MCTQNIVKGTFYEFGVWFGTSFNYLCKFYEYGYMVSTHFKDYRTIGTVKEKAVIQQRVMYQLKKES